MLFGLVEFTISQVIAELGTEMWFAATYAGAAAVVLFSGSPEAAFLAAAVALGGLLGRLASRREPRPAPPVDGRGERRMLVAVAVASVVLGTVLALGSPHLVGPLAGARGRQGNTVGVYVCADLACSLYLRGKRQPKLRTVPQEESLTEAERVARMWGNLEDFVAKVTAPAAP